jgi:TetR/AcrR family transcriptional regulator
MTKKVTAPQADPTARERLLRAAVDAFDRKSYAAATVREIVEAAGVTKPVLYYYFKNKEGLFQELMDEGIAKFDRILGRTREAGGSARERIEGLCGDAFGLFKENIPTLRILNSLYYGPPQGAPPVDMDRIHHLFQDRVKELLVEGRRAGEFRFEKTEDAMWAIVGALNIATEVELCHPEMALGPKDLKRVLGIVLAGIAAHPRGGSPRGTYRRKGVQP